MLCIRPHGYKWSPSGRVVNSPTTDHNGRKNKGRTMHQKNNTTTADEANAWTSQIDSHGNWSRVTAMLDPWLSTTDPAWINPIYNECFSGVFQSRRSVKHETTFQVIVTNLAKASTEICCPVDKRSWSGVNPLPVNFGVSLIRPCVEALKKHGYLTSGRTFSSSKAEHRVTYIRPTEKLLACSPMSMRYRIDEEGIIRCKDFVRPEDYLDNRWVSQRYHTIKDYNRMMQDTPEHQLYAVYKNDFQSMGRFAGGRVMMIKKVERRAMIVDGEPLFEADIKSCHPFIALAKTQGIRLSTDFYDIEGFPRGLVKAASMMALNCKSRKQAQQAVQGWINENHERRQQYQGCKLAPIFDALERKVPHWEDLLYQSRGLEFMADESLRMSLFLDNMTSFGIKVFPIHDAVMGKPSDMDTILEHFIEAFTVNEIEPLVKVSYPQ